MSRNNCNKTFEGITDANIEECIFHDFTELIIISSYLDLNYLLFILINLNQNLEFYFTTLNNTKSFWIKNIYTYKIIILLI